MVHGFGQYLSVHVVWSVDEEQPNFQSSGDIFIVAEQKVKKRQTYSDLVCFNHLQYAK